MSKEEIRVVDFKRAANTSLVGNNQEDMREVSDEIIECFENIGFVYIKNHGIPQEKIDKMFKMSEAFFSLPFEVKQIYARKDLFSTGYVEPNREILNETENNYEIRESFDAFRKSGNFPNEIEGFEQNILQTVEVGIIFFYKFLRCLEIGLDIPFGTLLNLHKNMCSESNISLLRLNHYPPIPFDIPENSVRCGEHTDYGTITILFQDNMGGLEVKNRNNEWVHAPPIPGTLLVNVGDMLQIFTSGRLIATKHRVLIPEEAKKKKCSRKSFVFFSIADNEVDLKPFGTPEDDKKSYHTSHDCMCSRLTSTFAY